MKIRVSRLRGCLELFKPVVPRKSNVPAIRYVLVKDGYMRAGDLENEVSLKIPEADGQNMLLAYQSLAEMLKFIPGDLFVAIESKDKHVTVTWKDGIATLPTVSTEDYPLSMQRIPRVEADIDGDTFTEALKDAAVYTATENPRPVLTGVAVILGNSVQFCGADGFRSTYESTGISFPDERTIIVRPETVKILGELWKHAPGKPAEKASFIEQMASARMLKFGVWEDGVNGYFSARFANVTLCSKLISGTYPDLLALYNGFKEPVKATFFGPDLLRAVKQVSKTAAEHVGAVRLEWTEETMSVSAGDKENMIRLSIPIMEGANPGRIGINSEYLVNYLEGKDGMITMGTVNDRSPAIFHYGRRPIVAIMPLFIKWDGEEEDEKPSVESGAETSQPRDAEDVLEEEGPETPETEESEEPVAATPEVKKRGGRRKKKEE